MASCASNGKTRLLVLNDWGLSPLNDEQRRDLLELVEDCHGRGSLVVISQVSVEHWIQPIGDPTLADAILDGIIHHAYRIDPKEDTVRLRPSTSQTGGRRQRRTLGVRY